MRILLKGFYGFGNFGDDLLMIVAFNYLREYFPSSEIYIFSNATINNKNFKHESTYNQYIKKILGENIQIVDWTYKGYFDVVLDGGGGVFFDYNKANSLIVATNWIISKLPPHTVFLLEKYLRKFCGKTTNVTFGRRYAIGINIGPVDIMSKRFISIYSEIGSFDGFLVRDKESITFLNRFRHNGYKNLISDIVFSKDKIPELKNKKLHNDAISVGFVIMNWFINGESYLQNIVNTAKQLEDQGYRCVFFAFCELDDASIADQFEYPINYWLPNEMTLMSYIDKLAAVDVIVSMRFHGLIIANCLGIPSIALGINTKIRDFAIQAEECCKLVDLPLNALDIAGSVNEIFSEYDELSLNSKKINLQFTEQTEKTINRFFKDISDKKI